MYLYVHGMNPDGKVIKPRSTYSGEQVLTTWSRCGCTHGNRRRRISSNFEYLIVNLSDPIYFICDSSILQGSALTSTTFQIVKCSSSIPSTLLLLKVWLSNLLNATSPFYVLRVSHDSMPCALWLSRQSYKAISQQGCLWNLLTRESLLSGPTEIFYNSYLV